MRAAPDLYCIRIEGELGVTALSAFPAMVHHIDSRNTVLTGLLQDQAALFGVLGQIEAVGRSSPRSTPRTPTLSPR